MIVRLLGLFLSLECLFTIYRLFSMTLLSLVIVRIWFIICDVNKYTGGGSNYHGYQYVNIPNWSRYAGSSRIFVSQGWNYTRYQHINYYSGGY
ncbi:TPA: hypothetical protein ACGO7N_000379 [Streptococcus suis]|nr:hypothetical protein [Streptococcus suis]AUC92761.1 hypothetical protein CWM22_13115 [Streptococcus suis]